MHPSNDSTSLSLSTLPLEAQQLALNYSSAGHIQERSAGVQSPRK